MEIALSIGANCTESDRLLKSLLKNAGPLRKSGTAIPGPGRYRQPLREALDAEAQGKGGPRSREVVLQAALDGEAERLVMVMDNFMAIPRGLVQSGVFYPKLENRLRGLGRIFRDDRVELFLAIRHPAAFLQEVASLAQADLSSVLGIARPDDLRWSDLVRRIRSSQPGMGLTVWCQEDAPLLWERILRGMTGAAAELPVKGRLDLLSGVLDPEGMKALEHAVAQMPAEAGVALHEAVADLWEVHAMDGAAREEITAPELPPEVVAALSRSYEADLAAIDAMEGVQLLLPFR